MLLNSSFLISILLIILPLAGYFCAMMIRSIGLTGGIATGKSTVSSILSKNGYVIIDADQISRDLRQFDKNYQRLLVQQFGERIWNEDKKEIRSDVLGDIIFKDDKQRKILNQMTHWRIFVKIMKDISYNRIFNNKTKIIMDAPLLFETKFLEYFCNPIITVHVPDQQVQINRLVQRNGLSQQQAEDRINSQFPIKLKIEKSDHIICNDKDMKSLESQVLQLINQYLSPEQNQIEKFVIDVIRLIYNSIL